MVLFLVWVHMHRMYDHMPISMHAINLMCWHVQITTPRRHVGGCLVDVQCSLSCCTSSKKMDQMLTLKSVQIIITIFHSASHLQKRQSISGEAWERCFKEMS